MDKQSAIAMVNGHLGCRLLEGGNTSFAHINSAKEVWRLNINPRKLKRDLHILLVKERDSGLIWLRIKGNSFPTPAKMFRVRQDDEFIDLEISSCPPRYMTDVKSGGTGYDFAEHIEYEWELTEEKEATEGIIIIEIEEETDGRWIAEAPEISGVLVYGSSIEEAFAKAQALALRVLADRIEHGESTQGIVSSWFQAA